MKSLKIYLKFTFPYFLGHSSKTTIANVYAKFGSQSYLEATGQELRNTCARVDPLNLEDKTASKVEPRFVRNVSRTLLGPGKEIVVKVSC